MVLLVLDRLRIEKLIFLILFILLCSVDKCIFVIWFVFGVLKLLIEENIMGVEVNVVGVVIVVVSVIKVNGLFIKIIFN